MTHEDIIDIIVCECDCSEDKAEEIFDEWGFGKYENADPDEHTEEECENGVYALIDDCNFYEKVKDENYWSSI